MLELKNITKIYQAGDTAVRALDQVSISFRPGELVAILGPSGCGKTTLLNIIGGLDHYTEGDLVINGVSTKQYKDADWDTYRNHSVGFVFQNYNLIPHQNVLSNVELALTLSGVSKAERRRRAAEALEKVGLGDQLRKKPNQMSGGQAQRVAIARALVNDPEILLADEPTGALDTATSLQIMELLSEIARDRLVILVTHNPDLAERYATRVVRLLDGRITDDSRPVGKDEKVEEIVGKTRKGKRSMSLLTAGGLSLNNLLTKKTRTILTAFAGSIGIIGIALILALSNGIQLYINRVQEDTLSTYPITLNAQTQDYSSLFSAMTESGRAARERAASEGKVFVDDSMIRMASAMYSTTANDLRSFKKHLEDRSGEVGALVTDIQYSYDFDLQIYSGDGRTRINPTTIFEHMDDAFSSFASMMQGYSSFSSMMSQFNVFSEMLNNDELLASQYDLIAGEWSDDALEVMLVVDEDNSITNMVAYILGLEDQDNLAETMRRVMSGETVTSVTTEYTFEDFLGMSFRIVPNSDFFIETGLTYAAGGRQYPVWTDVRNAPDYDQEAFVAEHGVEVRISGILRPSPGAVATSISGTVAYRSSLRDLIMEKVSASAPAAQQMTETPGYDIFSGLSFEKKTFTKENVQEFIASLDGARLLMLKTYLRSQMGEGAPEITDEMLAQMLRMLEDNAFAALVTMFRQETSATYDGNLALLGIVDEDSPARINLYAKDFASKDALQEFIKAYNESVSDEKKIKYTDVIGIFLSGVTTIINVISYVLIAFVAISLVVSSIMIGIITYISVLERIKEIGILRAIGASKRDISRVFNAETLIVGFVAGMIGILMTLLLILPLNAIIHALSGISSVNAVLPVGGAVILVLLSMLLTFIAGLIPSRIAARKDPVVALRTE